jgi:hypothetical protein
MEKWPMTNHFPRGKENRNVCIFSTLPGGYLPSVESLEDYLWKISTVRRDYHHPIHAKDARFNFGTGKVSSLTAFASATILAFGKHSHSHTVTTIFPFCWLDSR